MKKIECKKCGHEILLGIDDEERLFTCCGQPMVKTADTALNKDAVFLDAGPMSAKQPCNGTTSTQRRII